jgi:hypothetical protein
MDKRRGQGGGADVGAAVIAMPKIPVPPSVSLEGRRTAHVRRLFERFGLDPTDLSHWHKLLFELAGKPPGRVGMWPSPTLCMLRHTVEVLRELNPGKSDDWCCQQISKNKNNVGPSFFDADAPHNRVFPFKGLDPKTLRRKLADARKPAMRPSYEAWREAFRVHGKEA